MNNHNWTRTSCWWSNVPLHFNHGINYLCKKCSVKFHDLIWAVNILTESRRKILFSVSMEPIISVLCNRMPAILQGEEEVRKWLDFGEVKSTEALQLLQPKDILTFHPVSSVVNNTRNNVPECLQPVDPACKKVSDLWRNSFKGLRLRTSAILVGGKVVKADRSDPWSLGAPANIQRQGDDELADKQQTLKEKGAREGEGWGKQSPAQICWRTSILA